VSHTYWLPLPTIGVGEEKEYDKKSTILAVRGDVSEESSEPLPLWN
jgi:hypothetical protein